MDELKKAIRKISKPGGFVEPVMRATVISVDKNAMTCSVQTVTDGMELDNVKLKPVINGGDRTQMGLVVFPTVNSFVLVGMIQENNLDLFVLSCSVIESISLDTSTALNLLVTNDGKINVNAVKMVFNNGNNGGIPLVNPLTNVILKLQQQVNTLVETFNSHVHVAPGGTTSPTATPGPAITAALIKTRDIANAAIIQ